MKITTNQILRKISFILKSNSKQYDRFDSLYIRGRSLKRVFSTTKEGVFPRKSVDAFTNPPKMDMTIVRGIVERETERLRKLREQEDQKTELGPTLYNIYSIETLVSALNSAARHTDMFKAFGVETPEEVYEKVKKDFLNNLDISEEKLDYFVGNLVSICANIEEDKTFRPAQSILRCLIDEEDNDTLFKILTTHISNNQLVLSSSDRTYHIVEALLYNTKKKTPFAGSNLDKFFSKMFDISLDENPNFDRFVKGETSELHFIWVLKHCGPQTHHNLFKFLRRGIPGTDDFVLKSILMDGDFRQFIRHILSHPNKYTDTIEYLAEVISDRYTFWRIQDSLPGQEIFLRLMKSFPSELKNKVYESLFDTVHEPFGDVNLYPVESMLLENAHTLLPSLVSNAPPQFKRNLITALVKLTGKDYIGETVSNACIALIDLLRLPDTPMCDLIQDEYIKVFHNLCAHKKCQMLSLHILKCKHRSEKKLESFFLDNFEIALESRWSIFHYSVFMRTSLVDAKLREELTLEIIKRYPILVANSYQYGRFEDLTRQALRIHTISKMNKIQLLNTILADEKILPTMIYFPGNWASRLILKLLYSKIDYGFRLRHDDYFAADPRPKEKQIFDVRIQVLKRILDIADKFQVKTFDSRKTDKTADVIYRRILAYFLEVLVFYPQNLIDSVLDEFHKERVEHGNKLIRHILREVHHICSEEKKLEFIIKYPNFEPKKKTKGF